MKAGKTDGRQRTESRVRRSDNEDDVEAVVLEIMRDAKTAGTLDSLGVYDDFLACETRDTRGADDLWDTATNGFSDEQAEQIFSGPTDARPGSIQKVAILRMRYLLGLPLWHIDDYMEPTVQFAGLFDGDGEYEDT